MKEIKQQLKAVKYAHNLECITLGFAAKEGFRNDANVNHALRNCDQNVTGMLDDSQKRYCMRQVKILSFISVA